MYHLVYVSSAVNLLGDDELKGILAASVRNNSKVDITGMLLYLEGNFIQVLEGEEKEVLRTHGRICGDKRHEGLLTLIQGEIPEREFGSWSMGFKKMQGSDAASMPGYTDFLRKGINQSMQKTAALRLLDNFKTINK